MWKIEAFINQQWQEVSHSGLKNEYATEEQARTALKTLYAQQVQNQSAGGTELVRVTEVAK